MECASLSQAHFAQHTYHYISQKVKGTFPLDKHTDSPWDGRGTGDRGGCTSPERMLGICLFSNRNRLDMISEFSILVQNLILKGS